MTDIPLATGTVAEVYREEARSLLELSLNMATAARRQRTGWLAEFVRAQTQTSRILQGIIDRSHADDRQIRLPQG